MGEQRRAKMGNLATLSVTLGMLSAYFWDGNNEAHFFVTRVLVISGAVLAFAATVVYELTPKFLKSIFSSALTSACITWFLFFLFYFINLETSILYSALSAACFMAHTTSKLGVVPSLAPSRSTTWM